MSESRDFNELGWHLVQKPGLQLPDRPTVVSDVQYGGDGDPTDRRMVLGVQQLELLLEHARASLTGRVVLHGVGIRVQVLQDRHSAHRFEWCTLLASKLEPEMTGLIGG